MIKYILFGPFVLAGCGPTTGLIGSNMDATVAAVGDCKGGDTAKMVPPGADDTGGVDPDPSMSLEAAEDDVVVHLLDMNVNCCPTPGVEVTVSGAEVTVDFEDVTDPDQSCRCMCLMDFDVELVGLGEGTWSVLVVHGEVELGPEKITL